MRLLRCAGGLQLDLDQCNGPICHGRWVSTPTGLWPANVSSSAARNVVPASMNNTGRVCHEARAYSAKADRALLHVTVDAATACQFAYNRIVPGHVPSLVKFAQVRLHTLPSNLESRISNLELRDLDALLVSAFLDDLETSRTVSILTRNLRLTAIRSFFRFTAFEETAYSAHIQRVLAIPSKRHDKRLVQFLTRSEIEALLPAPDRTTWVGRRDHALLLLAVQTALRPSELIGLDRDAIIRDKVRMCVASARNVRSDVRRLPGIRLVLCRPGFRNPAGKTRKHSSRASMVIGLVPMPCSTYRGNTQQSQAHDPHL